MQKSDFKKISDWLWEIPKTFRPDMRVPARAYVSEKMLEDCFRDKSLEQLVNVATLPGIQKYALAMPDMHEGYASCLHPKTKVLTDFGFYFEIQSFEKKFNEEILKSLDFELQKPIGTPIERFIKLKPQNKVLKIKTKTGKEIIATAEHPFYTPKGMIELKKLKERDKIAVYPFEGTPYKQPSNQIIINEGDVKKTLIKTDIKKGGHRFNIILEKLKKRNLLPLTYDHPKLPYILKIMGFVFGDGSMNFIGRRGDGIIYFSAKKKENLKEIKQDIKKIGYTPSPIHFQKGKIFYKGKEKTYINYSFCVNASSLLILLKTLGVPSGKKVFQKYRVPKWIFKAPLWQKRLFLAAYFGAEMRRPYPRKTKKTMFDCPVLPMNKAANSISNGKAFLKDISKLLKEFGIETLYIDQRKKHINKKGEVTWELDLVFSSRIESLINLWSKIGFEYNKKRSFLANVAVQYLKYKKKILEEKEKAIKISIPGLLKIGLSYKKIAQQLATSNPLNKRFVEDICWKINKGFKNISPQVPRSFPSFEEYLKEATEGLGESGMVWDEIEEIKEILYKDFVYDFTVTHPNHNFIANNFVVSNCIGGVAAIRTSDGIISPGMAGYDLNCGMRLLKSEYSGKEIKPHLEGLATEIQKEVPSGLGRGRQIKLSIEQIDKILEGGTPHLVKNGYGEKEDVENCEANGKLEWADASAVSSHAKNRGRDQVGTLGSGNHFLELQRVDEIFDEKVADAFGLFKDQIVIMVHTGSRGLGHQVCTDYLREFIPLMTQKYKIRVPDREFACVPFNSPEGQRYFGAMASAANYAWANRQMIAHFVRKAWKSVLGERAAPLSALYDVAHNIIKKEKYLIDGKEIEVAVHRKGATRAFPPGHPEIPKRHREAGQVVLIPGSMGTASYVLVGTKEGEEAFFSTNHGAGRTMSRHEAMRRVSGQEVVKSLESKGIIVKCWSLRGIAEEAPIAYKNIHDVVEVVHNAGLSKKVAKLVPLAVIKGE